MLLDTHVLLWLLLDDPALTDRVRRDIGHAPRALASAASTWEIAIKSSAGKLVAPDNLPELIESSRLTTLPITSKHAWAIRAIDGLPHADPFDRLLVAQAYVEGVPLVTADRALLGATITPPVALIDARV